MGGIEEGKRRSLQNLSVLKAEEKRGDLVAFVATTVQSFWRQGIPTHLRFEALENYRDLAPPQGSL